MKEIIVHIGLPKTGTSYLQSLFGTNVKSLCSNQINYPDINQQGHNLDYKEVDWEPTKNGFLLLDNNHISSITDNISLYSEEGLFRVLLEDNKRLELFKTLRKYNFKVRFVAFVRDFFEHSFSSWNQYIKRGVGSLNYRDYMITKGLYMDFQRLNHWIELSKEENFELEIFKYEEHKDDLFEFFLKRILKIEDIKEFDIHNNRVNRSMDRSEVEFIRLLNREFGKSISNNIIKKLIAIDNPTDSPSKPYISKKVYEEIIHKYSRFISKINNFKNLEKEVLFTDHKKLVDSSNDFSKNEYKFTKEQLRKVARGLGEIFRDSDRLRDEDADSLRDIALEISLGRLRGNLKPKDSYFLMSLAKRARPNGPQILRWIENFKKRQNKK